MIKIVIFIAGLGFLVFNEVGIITLSNTDDGIHYMRKKGSPRLIIIGFITDDKKDSLFCWFHDYEGGGQYSDGYLIGNQKQNSDSGETYLKDNFTNELNHINELKHKYLSWHDSQETYVLERDIAFTDDFMTYAGLGLKSISASYRFQMTGIQFFD